MKNQKQNGFGQKKKQLGQFVKNGCVWVWLTTKVEDQALVTCKTSSLCSKFLEDHKEARISCYG